MKYLLFILLSISFLQLKGQQTINDSISHDGMVRSYILYVPQTYTPGEDVPLVINLHGYTSDALEQMFYGDFRSIADTAGFLVVHPQGTVDAFGNTHWNVNWAGAGTVDDVSFLEALIDSLSVAYSINQERVFSTGMSNGGFMSYKLACELSNRIAAIASVTGSMNVNQTASCSPQHPVPVMEIHGNSDAVVPYNGNFLFESTENVVEYWVGYNGCNADPVVTQMPDIDNTDNCTVEHYMYSDGSNGVEVEHYKVLNGGHTWPGSSFNNGNGNTNQDINASEKVWGFFRQYDINGRIGITGISRQAAESVEVNVYPVPADDLVTVAWSGKAVSLIRVVSSTGVVVAERNAAGMQEVVFSTDDFTRGVYVIQIYGIKGEFLGYSKMLF